MKENNESTVNWKKELLEWLKILLAAAAKIGRAHV